MTNYNFIWVYNNVDNGPELGMRHPLESMISKKVKSDYNRFKNIKTRLEDRIKKMKVRR